VKEKLAEFAAGITDEREMTIWKERMVAIDPVSLSALGKRYNVSKERIRQVEARIKKRLREYFEATLGDEIDFEFSIPEDEA
jgi:RNA polymerase sigma-32 factor